MDEGHQSDEATRGRPFDSQSTSAASRKIELPQNHAESPAVQNNDDEGMKAIKFEKAGDCLEFMKRVQRGQAKPVVFKDLS